jgi:RNA polymerase sigma factor (sigma-70 family)
MASEKSTEVDIELLIYRMAEKEEAALTEFLETCSGNIRGFLKKRYGDVLKTQEIEEAINITAFNVWRFADRFRTDRGSPKAWIVRIARNEAIDILRGEDRNRAKDLEYDRSYDPGDDRDEDFSAASVRDRWRVEQLEQIIYNELKGLEQAVAKADLVVGGSADAGRLASLHSTSKETVYVTRNKVRAKIRKLILEREAQKDRPRGKS